MIHWTKPAFEELDVSGECTAYAGALRASERPAEEGSTPAPRRDSTL
jgi:coenzyme PQQ precursor peptide PqqA